MFFTFLLCNNSFSQDHFYFKNITSGSSTLPDTFCTFLTLFPDGHAVARIRAKEPGTQKEFVFELKLKESLSENSKPDDSLHFLYVYDEPLLISGRTGKFIFKPRIVFSERNDTPGIYFEPTRIEIKNRKGNWKSAAMLSKRIITGEAIRLEEELVTQFYANEEEFYIYMMYEPMTAVPEIRVEKMFLILVVDTNDPFIGPSAGKDLAKVTTLFSQIAKDLGLRNVVTTIISGDKFSRSNVEKTIKTLKPSSEDIVIYYFSGHGFRYSDDKSQYPRMSLKNKSDKDIDKFNLSVEEIYKKILRTKPQLTMVISDCCNAEIGASPLIGSKILTSKGFNFQNFNKEYAQKLFFPTVPTSILIGASKAKQYSVCNPELGGFFTNYFTTELYQKLYGFNETPATWRKIISEANEKTRLKSYSNYCRETKGRCIQTPVFSVYPAYN